MHTFPACIHLHEFGSGMHASSNSGASPANCGKTLSTILTSDARSF